MFEINGETKHLGIIGNPIEHTYSPKMHNYISEIMEKNCVYSAFEVKKQDLEKAIDAIRALGFLGTNITAPYKVDVIEHLDVLSEKARLFGSVNTVVNKDGKLYGYTTDADGFYMSLKRKGFSVEDKDVLILGAGGAAKPVIALFAMEGAKSITVSNRTKEKTIKMSEFLFDATGFKMDCDIKLSHYDLVVNTTPLGMYPDIDTAPQFDTSLIDEKSFVADMIYNPEETLFLKEAKKRGAVTLNGLGMLIYQGIIAYELFTDTKLPEDIFDKILKDVFNK